MSKAIIQHHGASSTSSKQDYSDYVRAAFNDQTASGGDLRTANNPHIVALIAELIDIKRRSREQKLAGATQDKNREGIVRYDNAANIYSVPGHHDLIAQLYLFLTDNNKEAVFSHLIEERRHFVSIKLEKNTNAKTLKTFILDDYTKDSFGKDHRHNNAINLIVNAIKEVGGRKGYRGEIYYSDTDDTALAMTCCVVGPDNAFHLATTKNIWAHFSGTTDHQGKIISHSELVAATANDTFTVHRALVLPPQFLRLQQRSIQTIINKPLADEIASHKHGLTATEYVSHYVFQRMTPKGETIATNGAVEYKRKRFIDKVTDSKEHYEQLSNQTELARVFNIDKLTHGNMTEIAEIIGCMPRLEKCQDSDHYQLTFPSVPIALDYRVHQDKPMIKGNFLRNIFMGRGFEDAKTRKDENRDHAVMKMDLWLKEKHDVGITCPHPADPSGKETRFVSSYNDLTTHGVAVDPCPVSVKLTGTLRNLNRFVSDFMTLSNNILALMEEGCREPLSTILTMRIAGQLVHKELKEKGDWQCSLNSPPLSPTSTLKQSVATRA